MDYWITGRTIGTPERGLRDRTERSDGVVSSIEKEMGMREDRMDRMEGYRYKDAEESKAEELEVS